MTKAKQLSKVEKLRVAGVIAPAVRRGCIRRVSVCGPDGSVVRTMTLGDLQQAIANRHGIEFGVAEGERPKAIACQNCGNVYVVPVKKGVVPKVCPGGCRCQCGGRITKNTARIAVRDGRRAMCSACAQSKQAVEIGGKVYASISAASRALGIPQPTLHRRISRGDADMAAPPQTHPVSVVVDGVAYGSIAEAARALGVPATTARNRVVLGMKPKRRRAPRTP